MSPKKKSRTKSSRKSRATGKQTRPAKRSSVRKRSAAGKKPKSARRGAAAEPRSRVKTQAPPRRKASAPARGARSRTDKTPGNKSRLVESVIAERKGLGSAAAGQSGDIEGLSRLPDADSESVEELLEEGQSYEAEVVSGVERASDEEEQEVITEEVEEDDIPPEYGGSE
jgi:hypothetical protein